MRGRTNNPYGRPKGIPNKNTAELREKISRLIDENWSTIQKDIDQLEPRDRLSFLEKLLSYSLPKLQSIEVETDLPDNHNPVVIFNIPDNGRSLDYKSMSSDELHAILASEELAGGRGKSLD